MSFTLTWFGHAAFGLSLGDYKILIDPFISDNPSASVDVNDLEADFILISHGHGDHVGDALNIAARTDSLIISNYEIATWFEKQGFKVHGQHIGGGYLHPFGHLKLTLAFHGSALPDGSDGGNPVGFLLTTEGGERIYFACDTGLFGDMRLIGEDSIDLAVLPIGDNFTMGPKDALRAVQFIQPKFVIPVHYNTFELINQDPDEWAERILAETDTIPHILKPGESFSL